MLEFSDREILEKAEARSLVHGFQHNGQSKEWLSNALKVSKRVYGAGSEERIRAYMKMIWKTERINGMQTASEGDAQ